MLDIVYSPRRDGRDDETNDYTLAEDQGRYFGRCFEIFAILLKTFAKISTLIFNQCVVICLIVPAITSLAEINVRDFNYTKYCNIKERNISDQVWYPITCNA